MAIGGAVGSIVIPIGVAARPWRLTAGGIAQAEAVALAADAVHLGEVDSRLVGELVAEWAAP